MDTIKLYIADLHAYNRGQLQGEWISVGPHDNEGDILDAIDALLAEWSVEEYAIHDYDGLPESLYSEHMDLGTVAAYAELLNAFNNDVVEAYFQLPYWKECSPAC